MNRTLAAWFLLFLSVTAGWQAIYCAAAAGGDSTALFYAGALTPRPPDLPHPGYIYPASAGYDGQFYRLLARDPLARKGYWRYLDDPRYRARRILVPALAALAGLGSPRAVDFWYVAIADLALAFGGICFLRLAKDRCAPWLAAVLYLLIPAVVAGTDRMVVDGPAVAGFLAVWLFLRERRTSLLLAILLALPLVRETAICVTAGVVLVLWRGGQRRLALLAAATAAPAAAWWCFVALQTAPSSAAGAILTVPFLPQFLRFFQPYPRALPAAANLLLNAFDDIALVCLWIAFGWLARALVLEWRHGRVEEDTWLVLPSALLAAVTGSRFVMAQGYDFMRADSILIAWAALRMLYRKPAYAAMYLPASSLILAAYRAAPLLRLLNR